MIGSASAARHPAGRRSLRRALLRPTTLFAGAAMVVTTAASTPAAAAPGPAPHAAAAASTVTQAATAPAPRTIVTTDPELDDLNSMLRLLLYSNEIDIVGLVYSASTHHQMGDPALGIAPNRWPAPGDELHIDRAVDAYGAAYPNLVHHDPHYPTPQHLRSLIRMGNVIEEGDMRAQTPGSELIEQVLLDDRPGQVFLQAWGGANTIARALKSIDERYRGTPHWPAIYAKVVDKAVLTSFGQQDDTFADYIRPNWPDLNHREVATSIWGYGARGSVLPQDAHYLTTDWMRTNVSEVGPIGEVYRVWGDGKQMAAGFDDEDYFGLSGYTTEELEAMGYSVWLPPQPAGSWISEGDSSNFALLIDNGLRSWQDPTNGGWGGRQVPSPDDPHQWSNRLAEDHAPDGSTPRDYAAARWFSAIQNDLAARMQWTVTDDYADANHEPAVTIRQGVDITRRAGATVALKVATSDPDGDAVTVHTWQYAEAGSYPGTVQISQRGHGHGAALVRIPADAEPGQTIHLIAAATDDGTPALTSYQRVVITVR